jgi:hypothetical protein
MRSIAEPFGRLLKEIVLTIDRFGLRRRHLHKYVKPAEQLCSAIAERQFISSGGAKYQSRFDKYREKMFAFLKYDNVLWNNNNARCPLLRKIATVYRRDLYTGVPSAALNSS